MSNEAKNSDKRVEDDRMKVFLRDQNKIATVRKIEHDPVWGPQYYVSTYTREWGPEYLWVKAYEVDEIVSKHNIKRG